MSHSDPAPKVMSLQVILKPSCADTRFCPSLCCVAEPVHFRLSTTRPKPPVQPKKTARPRSRAATPRFAQLHYEKKEENTHTQKCATREINSRTARKHPPKHENTSQNAETPPQNAKHTPKKRPTKHHQKKSRLCAKNEFAAPGI